MKKKVVFSQYEFYPGYADTGIDYSELITVPDQVLSMREIYQKYAVTGQIAGLANGVFPHTTDDLDLDDDVLDFVPEEDVDILQRSTSIRMAKDAKASSPAYPAAEGKPVGSQEPSNKEPKAPAKPEEPATNPASSSSSE